MHASNLMRRAALIAAFLAVISAKSTSEAQIGLERTILLRQDLHIPGYEVLLVAVTLAPGGSEGRHTHFGELIGYILEGELTLEQDGVPTRTYKAGESGVIDAGRIHEGFNRGNVPVKVLATFVVEKGKPLTTPAPNGHRH